MMFHYAYLHGFGSSPASFKGRVLSQAMARRGVTLERPDLNAPSFRRLSLSDMLDVLDRLDAAKGAEVPWRLIGSSLGGYLAALWTQYNSFRVDRLVLLAPAFDMGNHLERLTGPGGLERWEREGAFPFPDARGRRTPVHFAFVEDFCTYPPWPEVTCPTLIVHGTQDVQVPIEVSRAYARERPHVRLIEVDDDHLLQRSLFAIEPEIRAFLHLDDAEAEVGKGGSLPFR